MITNNMDKLKQLAEAFTYRGIKLSKSQINELKNSKYSHLVEHILPNQKVDGFSQLVEETLPVNQEEDPDLDIRFKRVKSPFYPGVNHEVIQDLIDEIEEKFDLGVDNIGGINLDNVSLEDVKFFVQKYADRNIFDLPTEREVKKILEASDDLASLLTRLYRLAA